MNIDMRTIRVIHHHEPPHGWWAESPDIPSWSAAAGTYEAAHRLAEEGVRFALVSEAEDRGDTPPASDAIQIEHYVPESTVRQLAGAA